jgi:hypothetical protein
LFISLLPPCPFLFYSLVSHSSVFLYSQFSCRPSSDSLRFSQANFCVSYTMYVISHLTLNFQKKH